MSKLDEMVGLNNWKIDLSETLQKSNFPEESGINEQCIYIVPPQVRHVNPKAFTPEVVCIGPFHRQHDTSDKFLWQMEELKLKYVKGFLHRTHLKVEDFVLKLEEWENKIRSSYAITLDYESKDLIKIVLVDACFIIEHFLRYHSYDWEEEDPILSKSWMHYPIQRDLLLLENQLPFFVLDDIYNFSGMNTTFPSFLSVTFHYFRRYNQQNIQPEAVCNPEHFTDLVRTFIIPTSFNFENKQRILHVYSVSQLEEAGLKFEVSKDEHKSLLDLEFKEGVLTMPCFRIYDSTEVRMRNVLAFEKFHIPRESYISQYLALLDFLINNEKDVDILVDKKIIVNLMGDAKDVVTMVNNLCKHVSMPHFSEKYFNLCTGLNGFYKNPCNKYKAIFIHEYFNSPWNIASTNAAVLLLLLTLIQTICSVIQVVQGSKPK